ncbi:hypothetical protein [Streptomyces beihaiensis]|uniref:Uncharacterized protein n=1 Tax=Streptomyces beihaiensis TaxID=2984495 RepID=A0ABT3TPJ0_9ACTN|nr:hypothetical protein [Streptomyces beihaiensis]MCX3058955.1 hypothetical protein [Streptomyces beihaiensis]
MRLRAGRVFGRLGGAGRRHRAGELAEIEAEITAYGEALDRHPFSPGRPDATDETRADLARALDAYDEAKRAFAGDRDGVDALDVARALDEGRHALARLDARLAGEPLPERLPPCFFDPRHGRSTDLVRWTPEGGAARDVAVCAADARALRAAPPDSQRSAGATSREVSGKGDGSRRVALPAPRRPGVLVVRTDRPAHLTVLVEQPHGRRPRGYQLHSVDGPVAARIPLSRIGGRREAGFRIAFRDGDRAHWSARAELVDAIPRFDTHTDGQGFDVVRYRGVAGPGVLRHRGRGAVLFQALDDTLAEWAVLGEGAGDCDLSVNWPGPGYYQVRAHGAWTLTGAPES